MEFGIMKCQKESLEVKHGKQFGNKSTTESTNQARITGRNHIWDKHKMDTKYMKYKSKIKQSKENKLFKYNRH